MALRYSFMNRYDTPILIQHVIILVNNGRGDNDYFLLPWEEEP